MSKYELSWITENLAAGHAPFSHEDLAEMKGQGIDAIVNLCGEYCDLHEIPQDTGFEVYYLPIADECAPHMAELESAIEWVDEIIGQGKKVLVHCRFGIGRTGTFVTAYLLKYGLNMKAAAKILKATRANPSNYCQWKLLRKYQNKLKEISK